MGNDFDLWNGSALAVESFGWYYQRFGGLGVELEEIERFFMHTFNRITVKKMNCLLE